MTPQERIIEAERSVRLACGKLMDAINATSAPRRDNPTMTPELKQQIVEAFSRRLAFPQPTPFTAALADSLKQALDSLDPPPDANPHHLPWHKQFGGALWHVRDARCATILRDLTEAKADMIVRAVNTRPDAVKLAKWIGPKPDEHWPVKNSELGEAARRILEAENRP